jgi:hypothetical protein
MDILVNPSRPNEVYAAVGNESTTPSSLVYQSTDGGSSWIDFGDGLPGLGHTECMAIDTVHKRLLVAADLGIYVLDLETGISGPPMAVGVNKPLLFVYPNPFNLVTEVALHLPHDSDAIIEIFDMLGRLVERRNLGRVRAGVTQFKIDGVSLASGAYLLVIGLETQILSAKLLLIK